MKIDQDAQITTANKYIVVENRSLSPIMNADVQIYMSKLVSKLIVDSSKNVRTDSVNVTRQDPTILINKDYKYNSMNGAINSTAEASLKNSKVAEKTIEKVEAILYKIPTHETYSDNVLKNSVDNLIRTPENQNVTPVNIHTFINLSDANRGAKKFNKTSKRMTKGERLGLL
jgi:hypothetical protein